TLLFRMDSSARNYVVTVEDAAPRQLAAVRGGSSRRELGTTIIRLLDQVWPVVRGQGIRTRHNVVIYHGGLADIEAGVEIFGDLVETEVVKLSSTPAGQVVTAAHFGEY